MMKLNKAIAIPAIVLAAGISLAACGTTSAPVPNARPLPVIIHTVPATPKPAITHTVTATPTPAPTTPAPKVVVVKPAPAPVVVVPAPAPVSGPSGTNCGTDANGYSVYAGANTSCPFALNVAASYNGAAYDAGPQVISVYSPATGESYSMTYTWSDGVVTATGGNDASVQFPG